MQHTDISFIKAYRAFWKYFANFSGRTSKEAFWKAFFIHGVIFFMTLLPTYYVYESIIERDDTTPGVWLIPVSVYSLVAIIPTFAIIIRRLHDIDRHGCWVLLFLVPIAGTIVFFVMLSRPTAPFDVYSGRSGAGPYMRPPVFSPYPPPPPPPPPLYSYYPMRQYPFAPPPVYFRPLPPPRRFAPPAGGDSAAKAIILTLIVTIASGAYGFISANYIQNNIDRYFDTIFGNAFSDIYNDPYFWEEDPWAGENPWDDYWNDAPDYYWDDEADLTEDELAAIEMVKESSLEGFPEFTIEEVLLTRVDEYGLEWMCVSDEGGEYPAYYVYATGYVPGDFVTVYAGFDVYEDGTIELFNLDDGSRDEYYKDALELFREWYEKMLSGIDTSTA